MLENGKVYAWGRGVFGQLGNGSRATSSVLRQVQGLENIVFIDAGCHHALALTADDTVKSWGHNLYGQRGTPRPHPPRSRSTSTGSRASPTLRSCCLSALEDGVFAGRA
ncbi:hypothetical protein [Streptomyces scabiei]|uniref:hypothetical protein n=1 Tax=Streptomyces scabiei TaxID=1930 RepID=UPI002D219AFC|nr:hypothetical protein [Streptomyces scabiei]